MAEIKAVTDATFDEMVINNERPVVVDFWATWCGPCKMVAPEMEKIAAKYDGAVDVVKVDVDANPSLSQKYGIMSIPTIAFFRPGQQPMGVVGFRPMEQLEQQFGLADFSKPAVPRRCAGRAHRRLNRPALVAGSQPHPGPRSIAERGSFAFGARFRGAAIDKFRHRPRYGRNQPLEGRFGPRARDSHARWSTIGAPGPVDSAPIRPYGGWRRILSIAARPAATGASRRIARTTRGHRVHPGPNYVMAGLGATSDWNCRRPRRAAGAMRLRSGPVVGRPGRSSRIRCS